MIAHIPINIYILACMKLDMKTRALWTPWLDVTAAAFRCVVSSVRILFIAFV